MCKYYLYDVLGSTFELLASVSISTMRYVPKDRLNGRVQLDDIERALKLQLWEYMQKQVGHTDRELDQAYSIGFMDGINSRRRDYNPEPYREPAGATIVTCGDGAKSRGCRWREATDEALRATKPLASE